MPNTALHRTVVALLTNQSGGAVAQGDVVVIDSANATSFTTTTTSGFATGTIGVVLEPNGIASAAIGTVAIAGYVPKVNLSAAASLGDLFKTHSVAKQAIRHASPIVAGDFGEVLTTGTSPAALLWGQPAGGAGGGGGSLELTDGTTDLTGVTKITTTMLKVGGTAGASTLTPNLTTASNQLGADVTMTNANQYYDGPSITLAAGTWLIIGTVTVVGGAGGAADITAKLWDGTTVADSAQVTNGGAAFVVAVTTQAIVTPTGSTTYKISAAGGRAGGTLKAAAPNNAAGNTASTIVAIRIA